MSLWWRRIPFTKGCSAAPCLSPLLLHPLFLCTFYGTTFLLPFLSPFYQTLQARSVKAFHIPHRLLPFVHSYFFRLPLVHPSWYMPMHPSWYILIRPSWYMQMLIHPSWKRSAKCLRCLSVREGSTFPFEQMTIWTFLTGVFPKVLDIWCSLWSFNPRQALENPSWRFPSVFWSPPIIYSWRLRPSEATACQDDLGHLPKHTADAASEVTYFDQC